MAILTYTNYLLTFRIKRNEDHNDRRFTTTPIVTLKHVLNNTQYSYLKQLFTVVSKFCWKQGREVNAVLAYVKLIWLLYSMITVTNTNRIFYRMNQHLHCVLVVI